MSRLTLDDLTFDVRRSRRRATIGITVDRDGTLIIRAPHDCPADEIERVARQKRAWVYTKLAEKERLQQSSSAAPKAYVSGEGFYYLGRSHRLFVIDTADIAPLRLYRGHFLLRRDAQHDGRRHFIAWYTAHAERWLSRRIERFTHRLEVGSVALEVRDLGHRWASCHPDGAVAFHWRTILLPPRICDYLLVHELAHLHEPNHGPAFWRRVGRTLPDYAARRDWLALNGAAYDL